MPDHRADLLALLKQHGQPLLRKTEEEDVPKKADRSDSQVAVKEVQRTRQPETKKRNSQSKSDVPKKPVILNQHSDGCRRAGEEIPPDLPEVLKQQLSVVNELIELSLAEAEAFKIDDVARIRLIVDQQQKAIDRMQVLEQCRTKAGLPIPPCLIERAKRLQQINETDRLLARMALSFNKMMQKALGLLPSGSYDDKGMPSALQKTLGRFDASA